ncbi:uncharacterized protein LOC142092285 isoform X4 [Calonectris borealis]|uniref:uncharacterized protein LOC142092285 isoform X4 n=1 Tax=Calonectris borealis TaxID=1323832 RepID=UPI003F4C402D
MTLKATWPAAASRCRRERPCLSRWRTAKRPELQKRKGGEKEKEAFEVSNSPGSAESESCSGGQPSDRSYRKGKEERRRKKRLNCQILPAVPRARAAPPPLPSSPSVQEPADRPSVPRRTDKRGSRNDCRGVPWAGGVSGAPSPGADSLPGLVTCVTK